jgi:PAS domain-containing protein
MVPSSSADSSAWCRPLFEGNLLAMLVCDPATQAILKANDAALACLGQTGRDLAGVRLSALYAGAAEEADPAADGAHETVRRSVGTDGKLRHLSERRCTVEHDGRTVLLVVLRDVSSQVSAEARLHDTQDELHRAQALARIGTWVWDLEDDHHATTGWWTCCPTTCR